MGDVLRRTAQQVPSGDALVFPSIDYRCSYAELDTQVDQAAAGLLDLGLQRGDHVALWCTNWPQWVVLQFATARAGLVLVNVNPAYRAHELRYVLTQSDARMLVLIDRFKSSDYFAMLAEICPEIDQPLREDWSAKEFPQLRHVVSLSASSRSGMLTWTELLGRGEAAGRAQIQRREAELIADDVVNIQYTSGTTGFPKGAQLTHRNLLLNAYYSGECQAMTAADRICIPVPFYHCFGCVLGTLLAGVYGAAMVVPHEYFDPEKTLDAVEKQRCTAIYGVPTMFIAQLEHASFAGRDLSTLRTGIMAGSPCPIELMKKVNDVMGARQITIGYGLTEASPIITQTRPNDPLELRVGSVGRPIPDSEVCIMDPERNQLSDGVVGELCARGPMIMPGYYNMPEATAKAIDGDGWLHTGDLAVREPNGYYRITGRLKDMIIRGGENVYPREIEEFLYGHPKIEEAQVVGVPDAKFGEETLVWIKLRGDQTATEEEIRDFCRARLAHYKVPRYVKFVDQFPMTVTGKIQKFKIREQAIEELGLQDAAAVKTA